MLQPLLAFTNPIFKKRKLFSVVISGMLWVYVVLQFKMETVIVGRPKKNGTYLNISIEIQIYDRLEALCEDDGQTKPLQPKEP